MARLSDRIYVADDEGVTLKNPCGEIFMKSNPYKMPDTITGTLYQETNLTTQENTMNTLRTLTLTLIDNNTNLEDHQRVVFRKKDFQTSMTNQQAKEDILASGEVKVAIEKHNKDVRAKVVRQDILENTGREVFLKPIKLVSDPELEWRIIETA